MKYTLQIITIVFLASLLSCNANKEKISGTNNETQKAPLPAGFIDLKDFIPGIIVDIRYFSTNNFMGRQLKGYKAPRALMLKSAASRLKKVHLALKKKGYGLKIFDAYRPMRAERHMIAWAKEDPGRLHYLREGYISKRVWKGRRVGHVCGNTVDLTIVDSHGRELDMGTGFDAFTKKAWTYNAEGKILKNRLMLKEAMEAEGFRYFSREWWHFTHPEYPSQAMDFVIR